MTYSVGKHVPCRQLAAHGGAAGHTTSGQQVRQSANVWVYDVYEYPLVMEHVLWATPSTRRHRILTLTMLIVWGDAITANRASVTNSLVTLLSSFWSFVELRSSASPPTHPSYDCTIALYDCLVRCTIALPLVVWGLDVKLASYSIFFTARSLN